MGTQNINLSLPPYNSSNWNSPLNDNWTIVDAKFGNSANISLSGTDKTLVLADLLNMRINLSGSIGGSEINVIFPNNVGGSWIVTNNTVSTGGKIFLRTAGFTVNPVEVPKSGSIYIFSDGKNLYSAVSGTEGAYLPLSGGTIDGTLGVNKDLSVAGKGTFKGETFFEKVAKFKDVVIEGTINLALTTIAVAKFTVGGAALEGNQVFGVQGESKFNGKTAVASGDLEVTLGSFSVKNGTAKNLLSGLTTIPAGGNIAIQKGGTVTLEEGANLSLLGEFKPTSVTTGLVTSSVGVKVTGSEGIKSGTGGVACEGAFSATGNAEFKAGATFEKRVSFANGFDGGSGAEFVDPTVVSTGFASLHFVSGNKAKGVITQNTTNQFGLYNESDLTKGAYLDTSTGKWKATGGIATFVNGREIDLGEMVVALHAEVAALKAGRPL